MLVAAVAAAAGTTQSALSDALGAAQGRGPCDRAATALAASDRRGLRLLAVAHRDCPPPAKRLAAESADVAEAVALPGTAVWTATPRLDRGDCLYREPFI